MLTSYMTAERSASNFLEGQVAFSHLRLSNNRSVMPLDVSGCMRATLSGSACVYPLLAGAGNLLNPIGEGDRGLQLFPMKEEFPVSVGHKLVLVVPPLCTHCPLLLLIGWFSEVRGWAPVGLAMALPECREDG
uniref:Uncharacterized protein n=1 Tax=Anas zonorhyncha TaxID=75864 RepID=A0A8B9UES4_9AVES